MDNSTTLQDLVVQLFRDADSAHRLDVKYIDDEQNDWPVWYADFLHTPLSDLFGVAFTRSQIVYCLMHAESERIATASDDDPALYYGKYFLQQCAGTATAAQDTLALYVTAYCPYCHLVHRSIESLDIVVEIRDINAEPKNYQTLVDARGRATVPVLRIISPTGESRWMPESADIVNYLERIYG